MSDMFDPPTVDDMRREDVIAELERELAVRRDVYPRWIVSKKIDPTTAHWRITALEAAIRLLR